MMQPFSILRGIKGREISKAINCAVYIFRGGISILI